MEIQEEDIVQIVTDIWTSMLDLDVVFKGAGGELKGDVRTLSANVQISGDWEGVLAVICSESLARRFAAAMLAMEPDELDAAEVHDAMGEIANIAGGNVKALVDGHAKLSLPVVTAGIEYEFSIPGSRVESNLAFDCNGETFTTLIVAKDE